MLAHRKAICLLQGSTLQSTTLIQVLRIFTEHLLHGQLVSYTSDLEVDTLRWEISFPLEATEVLQVAWFWSCHFKSRLFCRKLLFLVAAPGLLLSEAGVKIEFSHIHEFLVNCDEMQGPG